MRVKIGDTWYNSNDHPIVVQLTETEQKHIATMPRPGILLSDGTINEGKYAVFPETWADKGRQAMIDYMNDDREDTP